MKFIKSKVFRTESPAQAEIELNNFFYNKNIILLFQTQVVLSKNRVMTTITYSRDKGGKHV